jgi:hypothetical protein
LYGRAGRLTSQNGGFRPGQSAELALSVFPLLSPSHLESQITADNAHRADLFPHAPRARGLHAELVRIGLGCIVALY